MKKTVSAACSGYCRKNLESIHAAHSGAAGGRCGFGGRRFGRVLRAELSDDLTRLEGIIPALESAHALGALAKMDFRPEDIVVLTVSGRGDKDIETYLSYYPR